MVTPVASARASVLDRLPYGRTGSSGAGGASALLRRALDSYLRPANTSNVSDSSDPSNSSAPAPQGLDRFESSGWDSVRFTHVRAQLSFERTVYDRAGNTLQHESLDVTYERTELLLLKHGDAPAETDGAPAADAKSPDGAPTAAPNPLQALLDYTSPENTSNRILNFVRDGFLAGRFSAGSGDDARAAFQKFILPVIEGASQDVLDALGDLLPKDGRDRVAKTMDLVRQGLDRFAHGGDAAAEAA